LYLEGRQLWYGRTPEGLKKSIDLFQQAIAADPNYAGAYTGLGDTYNVISNYVPEISSRQAGLLAEEATRKALELDSSLPEAHTARANALSMEWKWSEAEAEFRRSLELNPNDAATHYFYAFTYLTPENQLDRALEEFHVALSLDPLSPIVNTNYATTLMYAHRYPEALAQFHKTLERDPNFAPAHLKLSWLYGLTGDYAQAVSEMQKFTPTPGRFSADAKGYCALTLAGPLTKKWMALAAMSCVLAGERDKALGYLEESYNSRETDLMLSVRYPGLDSIRPDPRYAGLMHRIGLPE
jgi:tetratricopeptide (TPR) repeat protein